MVKTITESKLVQLLASPALRGNTRAWASLVRMAALLPPTAVPRLVKDCAEQLTSLPSAAQPKEFEPLLRCMTSWGHTDQIFKLLSNSLASAPPADEPKASKRSRRSSVDVREEAAAAAAEAAESGSPKLALSILDFMLATPLLVTHLTAVESLPPMRAVEEALFKAIGEHVEALSLENSHARALAGWDDDTALDALLLYSKLLYPYCCY